MPIIPKGASGWDKIGFAIAGIVVLVLIISGVATIYNSIIDQITAEVELRITKTLVDAQLVDIVDDTASTDTASTDTTSTDTASTDTTSTMTGTKERFIGPLALLGMLPDLSGVVDNFSKIEQANKAKYIGSILASLGLLMGFGIAFVKVKKIAEGPPPPPPDNNINLAIKFNPDEVRNLPIPKDLIN